MRREESIRHPMWLIGARLVACVILPVVYFALLLEAGWLAGTIVALLGWMAFEISGCIRFRRSDRSLGFAWTPFWQRTRRQHLLNGSVSLFATPAIMLLPFTIGLLVEPLSVLQDRDNLTVFLIFYAVPWSLGAFLLYRYYTTDETPCR